MAKTVLPDLLRELIVLRKLIRMDEIASEEAEDRLRLKGDQGRNKRGRNNRGRRDIRSRGRIKAEKDKEEQGRGE